MIKPKSSSNGFPKKDLYKKDPWRVYSNPPPKKVKCFQCQQSFYIKFVIARQQYSQKNNWNYWTGEEKEVKICNDCLKKLYYDKPVYWETIKDLKKRNLLKSYIHIGHLT